MSISIHLLFLSVSTAFAWLTAIYGDSLFLTSPELIKYLNLISSRIITIFYLSFTAPSSAMPISIHQLFLSISTIFAWLTAIPEGSLFFLSRPAILSLLKSSSCLIVFLLFFTSCGAYTKWDLWRQVDVWRRSYGYRLICCRLSGFCSFSIFTRGSL